MNTVVPFLDLHAMRDEVAADVATGFEEVLRTCAFVGGPQVAAFEAEFARASDRAHCVSAANGTEALELSLRALGVGQGDEVILPANTFVATAEAVVRAGATPVLVDAEEDSLLIDVEAVAAAITPRTAAVVPVHLYGQIAPMGAIQEVAARHGLAVVEDAAQAQGATQSGQGIGHGSAAASTSFYPGKNLGAYGDGGAVVVDDPEVAARLRLLCQHGSTQKYVHEIIGFNSRLDTLQAVVLSAKLKRLEAWNQSRRDCADRYAELLDGLDPVALGFAAGDTYNPAALQLGDLTDRLADSAGSTRHHNGFTGFWQADLHQAKKARHAGHAQHVEPGRQAQVTAEMRVNLEHAAALDLLLRNQAVLLHIEPCIDIVADRKVRILRGNHLANATGTHHGANLNRRDIAFAFVHPAAHGRVQRKVQRFDQHAPGAGFCHRLAGPGTALF